MLCIKYVVRYTKINLEKSKESIRRGAERTL
nr:MULTISPECIES: palindromic element RPE5 domain-containing protein [unclassified Rickettsia]